MIHPRSVHPWQTDKEDKLIHPHARPPNQTDKAHRARTGGQALRGHDPLDALQPDEEAGEVVGLGKLEHAPLDFGEGGRARVAPPFEGERDGEALLLHGLVHSSVDVLDCGGALGFVSGWVGGSARDKQTGLDVVRQV